MLDLTRKAVPVVPVVVEVDTVQENQVEGREAISSEIHYMKLLRSQTRLWLIVPMTVLEM